MAELSTYYWWFSLVVIPGVLALLAGVDVARDVIIRYCGEKWAGDG